MAAARSRTAKFLAIRTMRAAGLLKFADTCRFMLGQARAWPADRRFAALHPEYATPPRHLSFDALNHFDWARYRQTGLQHAGLFARQIRELTTAGTPLKILEWGCGPGRLIRHMEELLPGRTVALTGSDYNDESIAWCRQNLPGIAFVKNEFNPPLPFPDAEFDVVYCFSVVTHLSEGVQLAWTKELQRVLKPGGLLICTTHGDAYRHLLAAQDEQRAYDAGRVVVQGRYQEGKKWFVAIHPEPFVREHLLAGWNDVRRIVPLPEDGMLQDVWVARKRATPESAAAQDQAAFLPEHVQAGAATERAPRFSIIMNVYNGEQYLRAALASVFAQTFDDWEFIFWDDLSTDGSEAVLRAFPADPRVRYFRATEHVSLTVARRSAISEARGEWLTFLDQDDLWTPDKLEKQARIISEDRTGTLGLVYGRALSFGNVWLVRDFDRHHEFGRLPQGDIFQELFLSACFICQSASCMRTAYVKPLVDIPPEFHCCSDYYLNTELASRYSAACTEDVVCWYRVHPNAMSRRYYTRVLREALGILERWKHRVDPLVYARHYRIHSSILGLKEITSLENVRGGVLRILRNGSIPYLLSRPFSLARRISRRAVRQLLQGVAKRPQYS